MPHLHEDNIQFLEEMADTTCLQSAQDIQDDIFWKMSAGRKIKLASDFFRFARKLNSLGLSHGTRRIIKASRKDS